MNNNGSAILVEDTAKEIIWLRIHFTKIWNECKKVLLAYQTGNV